MNNAVIVLIFVLTVVLAIAEYRRKQCEKKDALIEQLEDACLEKDAKIDVLIKALGKHQVTINEPRRRN